MLRIFFENEESWDLTRQHDSRTRLHALPQSHLDLQIFVFLFQSLTALTNGLVQWRGTCQEIFAEATKRKLFSSELVNDSWMRLWIWCFENRSSLCTHSCQLSMQWQISSCVMHFVFRKFQFQQLDSNFHRMKELPSCRPWENLIYQTGRFFFSVCYCHGKARVKSHRTDPQRCRWWHWRGESYESFWTWFQQLCDTKERELKM